jgi:ABC-2 type transport system permease protein
MNAVFTLARSESRLLSREWATMVFAFIFPPLTMMVIAGSFGDQPDEGFGNLIPTEFYVTGYLAVPMAAVALIGIPVILASYRERDVLRRFAAFGVPTRAVAGAQALVGAALVAIAALTVLAAAASTYGIPHVHRPAEVALGFAAGTATMLVLGVAIGLFVRSARSAQAIGLMAFFPMFLLSGSGPPPDVMSGAMRRVSDLLPLTHATSAIRDPWLDDGSIVPHLVGLVIWFALGLAAAAASTRRGASER